MQGRTCDVHNHIRQSQSWNLVVISHHNPLSLFTVTGHSSYNWTTACTFVMKKSTILTESINLNRITQKGRLAEPNLSSLVIQFNSLGQSTDWFGAIRGCLFDLTNSPEWNGWFMNYLFNVVFSYTQIIIFKFLTLISYQDVWFLLRLDFSFLFLVVNILLKINSKFWYNASWITSLTVWVNYHRFKFKLDRVFSKRFINQSIHLSESFRWIESLSNRAPLT